MWVELRSSQSARGLLDVAAVTRNVQKAFRTSEVFVAV